jgi:hypothetical protein
VVKELLPDGGTAGVEANCPIDVTMTDFNPANPSKFDTLAITVYKSKANGGLWYSSNWNGAYTVKQNVFLLKDQLTVQ